MGLGHSVKFTQVALGLVPKVFEAVDVVFPGGEQLGMINPQMAEAGNIEGVVAG